MVVVEILNEVHFTISIEVAQTHELVAAGDEQLIASKLHAERLEKSARDATPAQRCGCRSHDAVHTPDVAIPRGHDRSLAVRREIKTAGPHPALPRIFNRQRERVGDEGALLIAGC